MAYCLERWLRIEGFRVQVLAGVIALCSWEREFTLIVPLSSLVYTWVPANLMQGGNPQID